MVFPRFSKSSRSFSKVNSFLWRPNSSIRPVCVCQRDLEREFYSCHLGDDGAMAKCVLLTAKAVPFLSSGVWFLHRHLVLQIGQINMRALMTGESTFHTDIPILSLLLNGLVSGL